MKLVIIGGGAMGGAIADSLIKKQTLAASELLIIEQISERRHYLAQKLNCETRESVSKAISDFTGVLLAIKPQNASETMRKIAPHLSPNQVVLSIMAGISIEQIVRELEHAAVIRIMPNTPAQIGEGMSVYYATPAVRQEQLDFTQTILKANGRALRIGNEDGIDAATAISGSGPAYVFYIAEQMIASARKLGFSEEEATQLTQQTIKGAVLLWENESTPVDELRHRVTSPGGTTEAALQAFENNDVGTKFQQGLQSAYQRAKELAQNS